MITTTTTYFMLCKALELSCIYIVLKSFTHWRLNVFVVISKGSSKQGVDNGDNEGNQHMLSMPIRFAVARPKWILAFEVLFCITFLAPFTWFHFSISYHLFGCNSNLSIALRCFRFLEKWILKDLITSYRCSLDFQTGFPKKPFRIYVQTSIFISHISFS